MNNEHSIWVLEDNSGDRFVFQEILEFRYDCKYFEKLDNFVGALKSGVRPDLIIADLRLPDGSMINFLESDSAELMYEMKYLVVSSLDDLDILRYCFSKGAVDFITKPFAKSELIVKVERAIKQARPGRRSSSKLVVDAASFTIGKDKRRIKNLTSKEFQLFSTLKNADDHTVRRDELLARVWGEVKVNSKTLDVHLYNLRKKIEPLGLQIIFDPPDRYRLCDGVNNDNP